ncbi:exported hypothetical protein [Candidatus Sulfopaludibacter sp. SbA6]|nr:exported hypothetical protein [Candidatus Sulfopaludibacter sp. SbA6]
MNCCTALTTILVASPCFAQTARDYYNEIYAAGGLDRMVARYVCFNDNPDVKAFFIFTENKYLREYMISNGTFDKLLKAEQAEIKKDLLLFRGYDKGVPLATEDFLNPDGTSWVSDKFILNKKTPARVRFSISWETMRYKRSVEVLDSDDTINGEVPAYGRCERVALTVVQTGK